MTLASVPDGWTVWNEADERVVLAYRPDVFDGGSLPAPCLPTIYVTRGRRDRRPGGERVGDEWRVRLFLEPEVTAREAVRDDREAALEAAADVAAAFDDGDVDYRDCYQVPRPDYLDRLDELTGRDDGDDGAASGDE